MAKKNAKAKQPRRLSLKGCGTWVLACAGLYIVFQVMVALNIIPDAKEVGATSTAQQRARVFSQQTEIASRPTNTRTPTQTKTATSTTTLTSTRTPVPTDTPTNTVTPANSLTLAPTYTPTETASPTVTSTFTATETATRTPAPSLTPRPATVGFTPQAELMATMEAATYYATGGVNVRSCPRTTCNVVERLSAGQAVMVDAAVNGESVNSGNAIWFRIASRGEAYVYSGLVSKTAPAAPVITSGSGSSGGNSVPPTSGPALVSTPMPPQSPFGCNGIDDLNCDDFRAIGQNANAHLAACGDEDNLDGDGDGQACER